jgi:hypothetical protein
MWADSASKQPGPIGPCIASTTFAQDAFIAAFYFIL